MTEFYRLSEDLNDFGLFRGDVGQWTGSWDSHSMRYEMIFRFGLSRFRTVWIPRGSMYSVEQPFDWFADPNLNSGGRVLLNERRVCIWRYKKRLRSGSYEHPSFSSIDRLIRLLNGRPNIIHFSLGELYHIYEV